MAHIAATWAQNDGGYDGQGIYGPSLRMLAGETRFDDCGLGGCVKSKGLPHSIPFQGLLFRPMLPSGTE